MGDIEYRHVTKYYPGASTPAIDDFSLSINDGEFMVFVGPSGCGKTTALRSLAGLEEISEGEILLGGQPVEDVPARKRDVAMVFQSYALYPHMTVRQNMAFGLQNRKITRAEVKRRVGEASGLLHLDQLLSRRPAALSGGQRQRVAMGRAIVREPQAFLMDEPLSNLDAKLRVEMRGTLKQLHQQLGVTTIYVTHDQIEAMTLGDRVAVMSAGRLEQVAEPQELFDQPASVFVAAFIGSPPMNLAMGTVVRDSGLAVDLDGTRIPLDRRTVEQTPTLGDLEGRNVVLGMRPTDIVLAGSQPTTWPTVKRRVELVEKLGTEANVLFNLKGAPTGMDFDDDVTGPVAPHLTGGWVARTQPRGLPDVNAECEFAFDPSALHFFDATTGVRLT